MRLLRTFLHRGISHSLRKNMSLVEKQQQAEVSLTTSNEPAIIDNNEVPQTELQTNKSKEQDIFYSISKEYWAKQDPTVNGMLGGYDFVSPDDIKQSQQFLDHFINVI